jgi:magnesium transporter
MKQSKLKTSRRTARKMGKSGSSAKSGMPPGSLVHIGQVKMTEVRADLIEYNRETLKVDLGINISELDIKPGVNTWLRITGLHDAGLIADIGKKLGIDALILEDVLNTGQRPKSETEQHAVFLTLKTLHQEHRGSEINSDQVSLVLKKNLLVSFHESELDLLSPLFTRLKNPDGRIRSSQTDYLFYAITDLIVDQYFKVIEQIGESIDQLEDELDELHDKRAADSIHSIRKDLLFVRKNIYPLRDAWQQLFRGDHPLIENVNLRYFGDVADHLMQMIEITENYRELNSGIRDVFLSAQSNRMNQVMKVLTMIGTLFIPLTFIVGVYGMNFAQMPELHWKYGYAAIWLIMVVVAVSMLLMFKKRKWL